MISLNGCNDLAWWQFAYFNTSINLHLIDRPTFIPSHSNHSLGACFHFVKNKNSTLRHTSTVHLTNCISFHPKMPTHQKSTWTVFNIAHWIMYCYSVMWWSHRPNYIQNWSHQYFWPTRSKSWRRQCWFCSPWGLQISLQNIFFSLTVRDVHVPHPAERWTTHSFDNPSDVYGEICLWNLAFVCIYSLAAISTVTGLYCAALMSHPHHSPVWIL